MTSRPYGLPLYRSGLAILDVSFELLYVIGLFAKDEILLFISAYLYLFEAFSSSDILASDSILSSNSRISLKL